MYLFLKIVIGIIFLFLFIRECRNNLFLTLGNFFFILFMVTLFFDIFGLNQEIIIINKKKLNLIHLITDRQISLPFLLFFLQKFHHRFFIKTLLSIVWIFVFYFLEIFNEYFHIEKLDNWTIFKAGYIGGYIIILSLIFSFLFKKLLIRSATHATSKKI